MAIEDPAPLDPTIEALSQDVSAAKEAILSTAGEHPEEWWAANELKLRARNGWSSGVMALALNDLVEAGRFEVDDQLQLRLR